MIPIRERAARYVAKMPPAVSGSRGHDATFAAASVLVHGFSLSQGEALEVLREYNQRCSPPWSERELIHKVRTAAAAVSSRGSGYLLDDDRETAGASPLPPVALPALQKIEFDPISLEAAAGSLRPSLTWFAARSYMDPALVTSSKFLSLLYHGGKVLIFTDERSQGEALWPGDPVPLPGPRGTWFLIQPVDGVVHDNPRTGRPSRRSEESVTRWKFALLESDEAPEGLWLAMLARSGLPIVAIYSSGGRSIHALLRVPGESPGISGAGGPKSKAEWDRWAVGIRSELVRLGADPKALTAVRLSRLPQSLRPDKGRRQRLIYLDPIPTSGRIMDKAVLRDPLGDAVEAAWIAGGNDDPVAAAAAAARIRLYDDGSDRKIPRLLAGLDALSLTNAASA